MHHIIDYLVVKVKIKNVYEQRKIFSLTLRLRTYTVKFYRLKALMK